MARRKTRNISVRTYLINKYGVKPNGEPNVDFDELIKNNIESGEKEFVLELTPVEDQQETTAEASS